MTTCRIWKKKRQFCSSKSLTFIFRALSDVKRDVNVSPTLGLRSVSTTALLGDQESAGLWPRAPDGFGTSGNQHMHEGAAQTLGHNHGNS